MSDTNSVQGNFINRTDLEDAEQLQPVETDRATKTKSVIANPENPNGKCINLTSFYC